VPARTPAAARVPAKTSTRNLREAFIIEINISVTGSRWSRAVLHDSQPTNTYPVAGSSNDRYFQ
jgi:hypothetical protein